MKCQVCGKVISFLDWLSYNQSCHPCWQAVLELIIEKSEIKADMKKKQFRKLVDKRKDKAEAFLNKIEVKKCI